MTPLSTGRPSSRPLTEQDRQGFVHEPKVEAGKYYEGALVSRRSQMQKAREKAKAAVRAVLEKNRSANEAAAIYASTRQYPFWSTPSIGIDPYAAAATPSSTPFTSAAPVSSAAPTTSTPRFVQSANFVQQKPLREINAACRRVHEAKKAADAKKARDEYLLRSNSPIPQYTVDYPPEVFKRWADGREEFKRRARLMEGDLRARGLLQRQRE